MGVQLPASVIAKLQAKRAGMPAPAAKQKYSNEKAVGFDLDGNEIKFDSKREAKRWGQLLIRLRKGEIACLQRQVVYRFEIGGRELRYKPRKKLGKAVKYVADFTYQEFVGDGPGSVLVVEDAKGMRTDVYKLKWALMKLVHDIEVREV